MQFDLLSLLPKTSPAGSASAAATPSVPSSVPLWEQIPLSFRQRNAEGDGQTRVWLMDPTDGQRGASLMHNTLAWHNGAAVCSLSQVLEKTSIAPRYYLSPKACAGIIRRAEKRGKSLPPQLARALQEAADSEPILTSTEDSTSPPSSEE